MTLLPWLFVLTVAVHPAPSAFALLDVEAVEGRPVNRYRALELGVVPVRPIEWEVSSPEGVSHGLIPSARTPTRPSPSREPRSSSALA
ncbi:MAG: hypothetical protein WKF75_01830 [Singulisphaera sp.]